MQRQKKNDLSIFGHLGELRKRVFYSLAFILIFFFVAWNFSDKIYKWLSLPLLKILPPVMQATPKLAYTSLTEPFMMYIKISALAALFMASPFIFHQIWLFISPALYKNEKRLFLPFVFFTTVFFAGGGAFGYYVIFPFACRFFLDIGKDFHAIITINEYFTLAFRVIGGIALIFEMPLLAFLLTRLGLISAEMLIKSFKYAIVIIFIIAAVITPTPDIVTQSLFAGPMILLYLLSILIAKIAGKRDTSE